MEFLGGLVVLALGLGGTAAGVGHQGWRRWLLVAAVVVEGGILWSLGLDWGYSWVQESPIHMGLQQNVWILTPGLLALLALVGLARWGSAFAPYGVALALAQGISFIPILLQVERNTSMSFLALAPVLDLFGVLLAAFWMIPAACEVIPLPGTHWHRVAFDRRASWIRAIGDLAADGLQVSPPATVLESGEARGTLGGVEVQVTSRPVLWPLGYGIQVRLQGVPAGVLPSPPGLAPVERVVRQGDVILYEGRSPDGSGGAPDRLRTFLEACIGVPEASRPGNSLRSLA